METIKEKRIERIITKNKWGFCPVCSEPLENPKAINSVLVVCRSCFMSRTNDCMDLAKALKELKDGTN